MKFESAMKKVILVTAAADAKTILLARAHSTRADAIIVKPFSVLTLKEKIAHVMKGNEVVTNKSRNGARQ